MSPKTQAQNTVDMADFGIVELSSNSEEDVSCLVPISACVGIFLLPFCRPVCTLVLWIQVFDQNKHSDNTGRLLLMLVWRVCL